LTGAGVVAVATSPAIDRIALARDIPATGIVRASQALETPGGKAIHAAMVAAELGAPTHLVAPAGGWRGELLRELLAAEGLEFSLVAAEAETRATHTLVDSDLGDRLEIHDPPAALLPGECDELVALTRARASAARVVVIAGGLPPQAPADLHRRLVAAARERGAFTILDTSSTEAFNLALGASPDVVKPNLAELTALLGIDAAQRRHTPATLLAQFTERLHENGPGAVWLSLGERGSLLTTSAGTVHLSAPAERILNAVGCGDALAGGLAAGVDRGLDLADAAALGVAAAADKLGRLHSGRVERAAVEQLLTRVRRVPMTADAVVR
jgi:1-phosphofructokinase family hexose kinase